MAQSCPSDRGNWDAERLRCAHQTIIVACQFDHLTMPEEKRDRGEMQRIECPHWNRKRVERPLQDRCGKLDQGDALNEGTRFFAMRYPAGER